MPAATAIVQQRDNGASPTVMRAEEGEADVREAAEEGEVNKDQLAREVYQILKQRLIAEREQFWGF
jgi:hypothetical protein